jgi:hypothetical protein
MPANELDESKLSPEQQLTLEKAKLERVQAVSQLLGEQEKRAQAENEHRELRQKQAVQDAFEQAGVTFYEPALVETLMRSQHDVKFADDGTATGLVGGKRVPLKAVIEELARKHPTLTDGRTTRHLKPEAPLVKPRCEWSQAEKIAYLNTHSAEEFAAIPLHPVMTVTEIRTAQDWARLPIATKTKFLAERGESGITFIARLPRK